MTGHLKLLWPTAPPTSVGGRSVPPPFLLPQAWWQTVDTPWGGRLCVLSTSPPDLGVLCPVPPSSTSLSLPHLAFFPPSSEGVLASVNWVSLCPSLCCMTAGGGSEAALLFCELSGWMIGPSVSQQCSPCAGRVAKSHFWCSNGSHFPGACWCMRWPFSLSLSAILLRTSHFWWDQFFRKNGLASPYGRWPFWYGFCQHPL